jgi:superfamily I DNA and/or RNA helicase
MKTAWDRNEVVSKLRGILVKLLELLSTPTFSEDNAQKMQSKIREIEETLRRAEQRLTDELPRMACLQMSTIGSSHKLLASNVKQADSDDEIDALVAFESLTLDSANENKTIVIFDEAGCIPGYELLGLTRLETEIEALVLVGDKEQLPPYQPSASFSSSPHVQSRRYSNRGRGFAPPKQPQVKSLLDYSRLSLDSGEKVKLTTQYRVPRDIAAILNDRVYNGDYKTAPTCKAPAQGLRFVHVRQDAEPRRKYVNRYEVDEVLDIIARHQEEQVMVITPVSRFWSSPSDCSSRFLSTLSHT